jgi:hypothetical protein
LAGPLKLKLYNQLAQARQCDISADVTALLGATDPASGNEPDFEVPYGLVSAENRNIKFNYVDLSWKILS